MDDLPIDDENCRGEKAMEDVGFEPQLGMTFPSRQAAFDFYNAYGYILGFSIRKNSRYKNTKGEITSLRLVCSKQGLKKGQKVQMDGSREIGVASHERTPEKQVSDQRCGCNASCHVKLYEDGVWRITGLHKDHNHPFVRNTPSKKRHLRSHKQISMEDRADIELLSEHNIPAAQIREILGTKAGGKVNLRYRKKDVNNHITSGKRNLVGVDVNAMVDYFMRSKQEDEGFFFDIEPDDNNAAKNIFWVDGRSRRAYEEFGDVVVFDTTYNTNKYSMPMAPFIGVNHHRQSIFFGCALIRDEKKTTFSWLFKKWLEAMGEKKPQVIFTDQCPSMKAAIEMVFGANTLHRCCLWHVMRKARDYLGVIYGSVEGFRGELVDVINLSLTGVDFEKNWCVVLKKYGMEDNSHLNLMFDRREEWVPAYFRETFCAGMCTTQRSESMNAVTKIWMDSNTSLYNFATKFEKMVECVFERESDEDICTMNATPKLWSSDPIEVEARKIYTRSIFSLFKDNLKECTSYRVHEVEKDKLYEVSPKRIQSTYEWDKPNRMVRIDKINCLIDCECKGFLFHGLLCSHALKVMERVEMVPLLPSHYILKRWTREANANIKRGISEHQFAKERVSMMLHAATQRVQKLAKEAVKTSAAYDRFDATITKLEEEITEINQEINKETSNAICTSNEARLAHKFSDPPVSQCKGKRKAQRMKPPTEVKDAKKMRTCSYCHKKEGHNMRACPKMKKDREQVFKTHEHEEVSEDNIEDSSECKTKDDDENNIQDGSEYETEDDNLF